MSACKDITGQKFNRLTVTCRDGSRKSHAMWLCQCDCGTIVRIATNDLKSGRQKSCGCYHREELTARNIIHGLRNHPLYGTWKAMKTRCSNPNVINWKYYGGRGIRVCAAWQESFLQFLEDMGPKPEGYSIDRINNNGDYEPDNCRWATAKEQVANQRKNQQNQ